MTRSPAVSAGDLVVMRVVQRTGISNVPGYEGAAIDRVIVPPTAR